MYRLYTVHFASIRDIHVLHNPNSSILACLVFRLYDNTGVYKALALGMANSTLVSEFVGLRRQLNITGAAVVKQTSMISTVSTVVSDNDM